MAERAAPPTGPYNPPVAQDLARMEPIRPASRPARTARQSARLGERHSSLGRLAADELRRAILGGRYKPGERLVEDRLSADLGVSRIPVREALRLLSAEGLVALQPRRGASVAAISPEVAREMVEVRALLEGLNARLAARRHDPEVIAELREVLHKGKVAAVSGTLEELVELNSAYHDLLAKAGRNSILLDLMRSLRERTSLVFAANSKDRAREDWDEHSGILAAVIGGDEELASLLATRHVVKASEAALAHATGAAGNDDR